MKLIEYRDGRDYVYFWVNDSRDGVEEIVSDIFYSKEDANMWYGQQIRKIQSFEK